MYRFPRSRFTCTLFGTAIATTLCLVAAPSVCAQTYTLNTLVNFDQVDNGMLPYAGPTLDPSTGNIYGTTAGEPGLSNGTMWEYTASGTGVGTGGLSAGTLTTLATFTNAPGTDQSLPYGGVTIDFANHQLYGTTYDGGSFGDGSVWQYDPGTGTLTTLVNFNGVNGNTTYTGVTLDGSGGLYGVAGSLLWQYSPTGTGVGTGGTSTGTYTILSEMDNAPAPTAPFGPVLDSGGFLYGTSDGGGVPGFGTVWEYDIATPALSTFAPFDGANGALPFNSSVTRVGGLFFGTTTQGGMFNNGVLWYTNGGGSITDLVNFNDLDPTVGAFPNAGVVYDGHRYLYGTTQAGGEFNEGTVWRYDLDTHTYSTIENFDYTDGGQLYGGLAISEHGDLYGTTYQGGSFGDGTLFELTPGPTTAPEPGSVALLMAAGCVGLGALRRRRVVVAS